MADIVTLTCPNCGGKLQITPDIDRFACAHCGNEHLVKRSEGLVALQPLHATLSGLQRATDRAAAEMGLRRAKEELASIEARHGEATGTLVAARLALEQAQRRRRGLLVASVVTVCWAVCCVSSLARFPLSPSVNLPRAVMANGQTLQAGSYQVRLTAEAAQPAVPGIQMERWVEFVRGGKVVGREVVSIVHQAEVKDLNSGAKGPKPGAGSARVEMLKGDEYLRVWINRRGVNYLLRHAARERVGEGSRFRVRTHREGRAADGDPAELLRASDRARGGAASTAGASWTAVIVTRDGEDVIEATYTVILRGDDALVEAVAPAATARRGGGGGPPETPSAEPPRTGPARGTARPTPSVSRAPPAVQS